MVINQQQTTQRQVRALSIVGLNNQIKRVSKTSYKVKSQTSETWYDVSLPYKTEKWICSCPDHTFRLVECKHIQAVIISKQLRNVIVTNSDLKEIENPSNELICRCGSMNVIKDGIRKNKSGTIQRFKCKSCGKEWSNNLKKKERSITNMQRATVNAIHENDLAEILHKLGLLDDIKNGTSKCGICGDILTLATISLLYTENGVPKLACEKDGCYFEIVKRDMN